MKRITIKDIAQEAGMSIASVSRALASFEEDYPGMALEVYDINANDMSTKLSTEYNSGIRKLLSTGYKQEKCLMVGDAPGDCKAAEENGIFFYPILVNQEQSSWEQLVLEALDRLEDGTYGGDYQNQLIQKFQENLR